MTGPSAAGDTVAPLFHEPGGRWRTLAYGPILCAVGLVAEIATGPVVHWVALPVIAVVLTGFVYPMVVAAKRHVSVELSPTILRQGTEELPVGEIEAVLPPSADPWKPDRWESARTLGELSGVPRGRTAVGLRLRGGGLVRAWAKDDDALRARLEDLVPSRGTP